MAIDVLRYFLWTVEEYGEPVPVYISIIPPHFLESLIPSCHALISHCVAWLETNILLYRESFESSVEKYHSHCWELGNALPDQMNSFCWMFVHDLVSEFIKYSMRQWFFLSVKTSIKLE